MDYRALLTKYINHVVDCEGVDFIEYGCPFTPEFSAEEWAELEALSQEVKVERSAMSKL